MNTYQMAIMLLFSQPDKLSFLELKESMQMSDEFLTKQVASLVDCKFLICDSEVNANFVASRLLSLKFMLRY